MSYFDDFIATGILCEFCGTFLGKPEGFGFPEKCKDCKQESEADLKESKEIKAVYQEFLEKIMEDIL